MRTLPATVLLLLVLGGLILVRTIGTDVNSPGVNPSTTKTSGNGVKTPILIGPIPFQTIVWTEFGGGTRGLTVTNDEENWSSLWGMETPPAINFSSHTILIAQAGMEGSAGYLINITSVTGFSDHILVAATITTPGQNCFTASVITYPIHIIVAAKIEVPAVFNATVSQSLPCPM